MTDTGRTRVAIACQGGGSHTAFTAGVLKRLLGAEELAGYEVVGLSGTSGGAVCALLAWSALLEGDPAAAGGLLEEFWADNSATTPLEQLVNAWVMWAARLENLVVLPAVSPYDTYGSVTALAEFRAHAGAAGRLRPLRRPARRGRADAAARGRRRPLRRVQGVQQPPRPDHRRHGPGLGGHPHPVPGRAGRGRHLLGRPVLPEPAGQGAGRHPPGRALGDPDQPEALGRRAEDDGRDRRPAQRARRQPVAAPGARLHREGRPAARRGPAGRRRPLQADRGPGDRAGAAPAVAVARHRLQAEPRPGLHPRADRPRRDQGGRVPGRAGLRGRLAAARPQGRAGLLRRRRRAGLGAAVPGPGQPPRQGPDRPVRAPAPDRRPARRPDPQAGGPRPGELDGDGLTGRRRPAPVRGRAEAELRDGKVTALRLGG